MSDEISEPSGLNFEIKNAKIAIGSGLGKYIIQKIHSAKKSIVILSPYLTGDYLNILQEKMNEGVSVKIITSSDFAKNNHRREIIEQLVSQVRNTNEENFKKKVQLKRLRVFALIAAVLFFCISFKIGLYLFWVGLASFIVTWILKGKYEKIIVYTYDYKFILPTQVVDTNGYDGKLMHVKAYLIDDKIAFIGSINFTRSAFYHNIESRIELTDKESITKLREQIEQLEAETKHSMCSYRLKFEPAMLLI